jgi:dCTP deaminase
MYLSDRDLNWAIQTGRLIVDPPPKKFDATSLDIHLDKICEAKIWNTETFLSDEKNRGRTRPELYVGKYHLGRFSGRYLGDPPAYSEDPAQLVGRRDSEIVLKPHGFMLWQTEEVVGTPDINANFICFVDGKSTKARAGIVIHLTAPTIHASWKGKITLEIANLGPFDLVLQEKDVIAQLTVASISSPPHKGVSDLSSTYGQVSVRGRP